MPSKKEIVDAERKFWDAMVTKDARAARSLVASKLIVTGGQGVATIEGKSFASMMDGASWTLEDYEFEDVSVVYPLPDVAVVGYKVTEHLTVDGEPVIMNAADASVWVRKNDEWRCVLHTESLLGDPYGRDRMQANATS